jgi:hypothetical protein
VGRLHTGRGALGGWCHCVGAVLLMVLGGLLLSRAWPAIGAYARYHQVKYGSFRGVAPSERVAALEPVHARIPEQYYVSELASDICWESYLGATGDETSQWAEQSLMWCERALATGSGLPGLHSRKASLLARESMRGAARYWAAYVDEVYWHPANQALLCEFYARAGMLEEAAERLALLDGHPEYATASRLFREAVRAHMRHP